ncbi:leucine-rich repeat protein 2-like isoform X2 [Primulina huaijiensis]|uniref:leucine-rich repeat protein 2-like isoform X2 n=1 Tax=Primulina huaijiensis TaxID=1492673 RepID=UPI003CC72D53
MSTPINVLLVKLTFEFLPPSFSVKVMASPSLFLGFILPIFFSLSSTVCTNSEGNALHALRIRLSDPTNVLQSWDPTLVNPCTWFHVTCDSNSHVIRLDLGNSNISGSLGSELGELKHLQYLELYKNNIGGQIPDELGNLEKLISLDLYGNKFEGKIPKSLSKLKSLRFLRVNDNKLTGSIPRELTNLSKLKLFDVSNNDLCGTIPVDGPFGNFPMESFENNRLNGPELKGLVSYDFGC